MLILKNATKGVDIQLYFFINFFLIYSRTGVTWPLARCHIIVVLGYLVYLYI